MKRAEFVELLQVALKGTKVVVENHSIYDGCTDIVVTVGDRKFYFSVYEEFATVSDAFALPSGITLWGNSLHLQLDEVEDVWSPEDKDTIHINMVGHTSFAVVRLF